MSIKKKIIATALSGLAITAIVAATTFAFPQLTNAQTDAPAAAAAGTVAPGGRGDANKLTGDRTSRDKYLAEALGITEDELQAAQTAAREAAISQAVTDGLITQAQADAMLNQTAGQRGGRISFRFADLDNDQFLADALNITVDKLDDAQQTAKAAELAQAVTDGRVTQEQADLITAERALKQYIEDEGLFESAVASAVRDGVITQAQADAILADAGPGMFGLDKWDGMERGGRGGHGPARGLPGTQDSSDSTAQGSQS